MDLNSIQQIYESLKVVRKATEDDYELRSSADEKVWGIKVFSDDPKKATLCLYAGPDAKEMACDLADYELDDDGDDEDDEDDDN